MKKVLLTTLFALLQWVAFSQSNYEIANVYFSKAEKAMEEINYKAALNYFNKGEKLLDSIQRPEIAERGILIHFELKDYRQAMNYAKKFFKLSYNKSSEQYNQMLNLYVDMGDKLVEQQEEQKRKAEEKLAKARELRRIDSLKTEWKKLSETFLVAYQDVRKFNKNNIALYKEAGKYGIIDDTGKRVMPAKEYAYAVENEGYFVFTDTKINPKKIYCYNTNTKTGTLFPSVEDFNSQSTSFGKITLPRTNGRIVTYPTSSFEALVYNVEERKYIKISNFKEVLKSLKKSDKIDKFDEDDRTIKINKKYYNYGGHLGGGVFRLALPNYNTYGYLFSNADGQKIILKEDVAYFGAFYNGKIQGLKSDESVVWYNEQGEEVSAPKKKATYTGKTKVEKQPDGRYKFIKNGVVILGDKKLETMQDYMRRNKKK